jgi:MFS family permease
LGLSTALSLMGDATLYTVLPTQTAAAGIALSSVGILLGANRAVRLLLNGPAGLAYDRSPRRWLYVPALFVGALSTAIYAATTGFWPLLLGRLVWGLAWSGIWVGGATVILDVSTDRDRGRWTGLYQTWFFFGGALGAFTGGLLTDRLGYATSLWVSAGITAAGGLAALLFLPETRASRGDRSVPRRPRERVRLRGNRGLWIAASLQGMNRFVASGVLAATLGLLVQNWLKSTPARGAARGAAIGVATLTGVLSASRAGLSSLAAPLAGALSDRLGDRWRIVIGSLILGALSMALLTGNTWAAILAGIAGAALVRGSSEAMVTALTGDLVRAEQRGRAIGLVHTASDLGSAIAPPVAYLLLPWLGIRGVYLGCAALFVIELGLVLWFRSWGTADLGSDEVPKATCPVPTVEH